MLMQASRLRRHKIKTFHFRVCSTVSCRSFCATRSSHLSFRRSQNRFCDFLTLDWFPMTRSPYACNEIRDLDHCTRSGSTFRSVGHRVEDSRLDTRISRFTESPFVRLLIIHGASIKPFLNLKINYTKDCDVVFFLYIHMYSLILKYSSLIFVSVRRCGCRY